VRHQATGGQRGPVDITPSASRLTQSLRDIGYDFNSALADLADNSISAGACRIDIEVVFEGDRSYVLIADDGWGMSSAELSEALRFGTRRDYADGDLGRYGLGLKTASISQCRQLTVVTRRNRARCQQVARTLSIDWISATDRWEVTYPPEGSASERAYEWLRQGTGTVVVWEHLDRILPKGRHEGAWAKRRLERLARRAADHLGMVFHRFLETDTPKGPRLTLTVNGVKVRPWNPFAPDEEHTHRLPDQSLEVVIGEAQDFVRLQRYVLPPRDMFSSSDEFERLSGPLKWNRQQGLYIYRADRLIQSGGWCNLRTPDEHTKVARASLDFPTSLDEAFRINVAKMRTSLPSQVRTLLERPLHELCQRAESVYRGESARTSRSGDVATDATTLPQGTGGAQLSLMSTSVSSRLGATIMSAALDAGEDAALVRIMERVRVLDPEAAAALGW
jgi:hypothetical protein